MLDVLAVMFGVPRSRCSLVSASCLSRFMLGFGLNHRPNLGDLLLCSSSIKLIHRGQIARQEALLRQLAIQRARVTFLSTRLPAPSIWYV